jgi:hypothetical protein
VTDEGKERYKFLSTLDSVNDLKEEEKNLSEELASLHEEIRDCATRVFRSAALRGISERPRFGVCVEIGDAVERLRGEEVVADIADSPLDAAFLVAARGSDVSGA